MSAKLIAFFSLIDDLQLDTDVERVSRIVSVTFTPNNEVLQRFQECLVESGKSYLIPQGLKQFHVSYRATAERGAIRSQLKTSLLYWSFSNYTFMNMQYTKFEHECSMLYSRYRCMFSSMGHCNKQLIF